MNWWQRVVGVYHQIFNVKFALISAVFNGGIAMVVNGSY